MKATLFADFVSPERAEDISQTLAPAPVTVHDEKLAFVAPRQKRVIFNGAHAPNDSTFAGVLGCNG